MTGTAAQTPVMDVMEIPAEPQVFQSGTQSTGLELVDTYLWIFKHFIEGKELTRSLACQVYIKPYSDRMDSVTFQSVAKRSKVFLNKLQEPTSEMINKRGNTWCQRQDYWPFFAIFNVRYWSLMLSAFRHFIITDWRGVFCQHSRFAFFL